MSSAPTAAAATRACCRFRPCIDLRSGAVVQIVGGTLRDAAGAASGGGAAAPAAEAPSATTNFVAAQPAEHFAALYRAAGLRGGHVILLGGGAANEAAARAALAAYPGGLQVGGGVTPQTAPGLLAAGASHVIVTSFVFREGRIDAARLAELVAAVGRERLVLDLSCRRRRRARRADVAATPGEAEFEYVVVTDRWQTWTDCVVDRATLEALAQHCAEFLVHGVDVEGLRQGVEDALVELLGRDSPIPVTYAGGVRNVADVEKVRRLGRGRVDVSVGSALDVFGGDMSFEALCEWSRRQEREASAADGGAGAGPAAAEK